MYTYTRSFPLGRKSRALQSARTVTFSPTHTHSHSFFLSTYLSLCLCVRACVYIISCKRVYIYIYICGYRKRGRAVGRCGRAGSRDDTKRRQPPGRSLSPSLPLSLLYTYYPRAHDGGGVVVVRLCLRRARDRSVLLVAHPATPAERVSWRRGRFVRSFVRSFASGGGSLGRPVAIYLCVCV